MHFDRAHTRRADRDWLREAIRRGSFLLLRGDSIGVHHAREILWSAEDLGFEPSPEDVRFLGEREGHSLFSLDPGEERWAGLTARQQGELAGWRALVGEHQISDASLAAYALSLERWHERTRFCGRCGSPMQSEEAGHSRSCSREGCEGKEFPRTDPVVIAVVTRGDSCLLGRHNRARSSLFFTALAGFVEPGESAEEAVAREIFEEAGVRVTRVRYFGSQPWPFPHSLMLGFYAETEDEKITVDPEELIEARWFTRDEILSGNVPIPPRFAIATQLIEGWAGEKKSQKAEGRRQK
jgi:NAD+ diphosphatase